MGICCSCFGLCETACCKSFCAKFNEYAHQIPVGKPRVDASPEPDWQESVQEYNCVFPLLLLLVGGFIVWGYSSGGKHMKIEDDATGIIVFTLLWIAIAVLYYAMYLRLDRLSDPDNRYRWYDGVGVDKDRSLRRHVNSCSYPWDSYQWAMGFLLLVIAIIMFAVVTPTLWNTPSNKMLAYTWIGIFSALWVFLMWVMMYDPSVPTETKPSIGDDRHDLYKKRFLWHCKLKGCKCYYPGKYRKHCKACNKCVVGFDHHCPFLNQCIGSHNYKLFFTVVSLWNLLMLYMICLGGYVIFQTWHQPGGVDSEIRKEVSKVWGNAMYTVLVSTAMFFSVVQMPFVLPLLCFHIKLCVTQSSTGEFHGSFMYTNDSTGKPRGREAYLDIRAERVLTRLAEINFMDQSSAMRLWKQFTSISRQHRENRATLDGMSELNKQLLEITSGIRLMEPPDHNRTCGSDGIEGRRKGNDDIENGGNIGTEEEPLLPTPGDKHQSWMCGPH